MFNRFYWLTCYLILCLSFLVIATVVPAHHRYEKMERLSKYENFCAKIKCRSFKYKYDFIAELPPTGLSPGLMFEIGMWIPFLYVAWLILSIAYFKMHPSSYTRKQKYLFLSTNLASVAAILIVGDLFTLGLGSAN
jgi:hypothetical protein